MNWLDKIKRLTGTQNLKALSGKAGLPLHTFTVMLGRSCQPRACRAVRIAKALGVTTDWLFDDDADWPPVRRSDFQ